MSITAPPPAVERTASAVTGARAARAALERAVAAQDARRRADVEVLDSALAWAHAHVIDADWANGVDGDETGESGESGESGGSVVAGWRSEVVHAPGSAAALFGERPLPIAGAGTPLVAEFALAELAAALGRTHEAVLALVGDVLDLAHRLPRLWELVRRLKVPAGLAREAARVSRDLDPVAAGHADRLLVWQPARLNPHRIGVLVHEARLYADPDRAIADHDEALASRRVEVHHDEGPPGTSKVFMRLDTADALAFDHTVSTMAATMRLLGHDGPLGVRRAHAVGVLADPHHALDLLTAPDPAPDPAPDTAPGTAAGTAAGTDADIGGEAACVAADVAHAPATPFRGPFRTPGGGADGRAGGRGGGVVLVFHVTDRDLLDTDHDRRGVARSPRLGPVLTGRLRSWLLTAGTVTIQPVVDLDPTAHPPVDVHDPPARMAAMVRARDATCVFPGCTRSSEHADLDHITPYTPPGESAGQRPGQTHPGNLAPLCRRHHRAKTFGDFTYHRRPDGSYHWTLPTGHTATTGPPTPRPTPRPAPPPRP